MKSICVKIIISMRLIGTYFYCLSFAFPMLLKTTGDLPDDVDIASPDNEDIEKYVQARAESDGKVIDKATVL